MGHNATFESLETKNMFKKECLWAPIKVPTGDIDQKNIYRTYSWSRDLELCAIETEGLHMIRINPSSGDIK